MVQIFEVLIVVMLIAGAIAIIIGDLQWATLLLVLATYCNIEGGRRD